MSKVIEGGLSAAGLRFAIIVSRFNSFITERLLGGAMDALQRAGASADAIDIIKVPGSWEVPMIAGEVACSLGYLLRPWRRFYGAACGLRAAGDTARSDPVFRRGCRAPGDLRLSAGD